MTHQEDKQILDDKIDRLAVVLVRPSTAEQVGYTARLMSSYGVERGSLVAPRCDISSLEARQAASAQGAMRLATMQICNRLKDAVKTAKIVISVDNLIRGKDDVSVSELVQLVAKSEVALIWFSDEEPHLADETNLITHNLRLPKSKFGSAIPTSHSVAICIARIFEALKTGK